MTVGQRIKAWRTARGMTQLELAKKVGTSKQNISRYEADTIKDIPMASLAKVADALGTTPADLLGFGKDTPFEIIEYDTKNKRIIAKRKGLHQIIDETPDEYLDLIDAVLSMPKPQFEALASLIRPKQDT